MLDDIQIKGFRCLDGLNLRGTRRYNVIVGPNNSGKTSLLEALFMHCAPLNCTALLTLLTARNGGFLPSSTYVFNRLKWFFSGPERPKLEISINGKWKRVSRETSISLTDEAIEREQEIPSVSGATTSTSFDLGFVLGQPDMMKSQEKVGMSIGAMDFSFKSDKQSKVNQYFEFIDKGPLRIEAPKIKTDIPAVYHDPLFHRGPEAGVQHYDKVAKSDFEIGWLELLQEIDSDIEDISILLSTEKTPELFVTHKKLGKTPVSNLGDGIRRILFIATSMAQCKGGVLLIDELESSIHFSALRRFADWIFDTAKRLEVQIFITTHSLECIDAILGSKALKVSDLSLFKLTRLKKRLDCKRIPGSTLKDIRYGLGQEVRS